MKRKLLLLLLLANFSIYAQYTAIPDINFEKKLIALGIDSGIVDGQVLTSKISNLTYLDVQNSSITDLKGIENFVSLTNLICRDNYITAIDVTKLTALTSLTLYNNKLTSIDLSKNVKLNWLDIQRNELVALDVANNTALKTFYCGSNKITSIDVSKNNQLTDFYCSLNPITSLDLTNNTALKSLICSNPELTTLDLSKNTSLTNLDCSGSSIKSLDLSKCTVLTAFKCNDVASLTYLNLKNGNNTNFTVFDIRRNYAISCVQVDDPIYSNRYWLTLKEATASFSDNCYGYTAIPDPNFEAKLIADGIDKEGKDGKVLTFSISKIASLDLKSSSITDLTGIEDFTNLLSLYCPSNQLTTINLAKNQKLTNVDVSSNKLTSLNIQNNTALTDLKVDSNQLTELDMSKNLALVNFSSASNPIAQLDFSLNSSLKSLNCSNNSLTNLNLKNGSNNLLNTLDIKNNPNLTCIEVDDVAYANTNWTSKKDATAAFSTDCTPTYTLIPDVNFENKLIALGIDSGIADGKILTSNITNVISLDVADSNISDLTGLQDFTSLKYFFCDRNKLTTADFSKNLMLENIGILDNAFTSIDVTKNTKLHTLELSKNQISTLDLSQNTNLKRLGFENNNLKEIDLSHNTELWFISGFGNQLTNLDLSKNTALTTLDISDNKLVELNLRNGKNTILDSSLNLKNNPNLTCIKVDDVAYASANWATKKDDTASFSLYCLPTYTSIPDVNFENKLIALAIDSGAVDGKVLTANITSVTELDLYGANISDLTGIENFKELTNLNCMSNKLESIDVSQNLALTNLNIAYNKLTTIDISKNSALENLSAFNNELTQIDVSNNSSLQYFTCSSNPLTTIDVSNNKKLTSLWCSSTSITNLDVSKNASLNAIICTESKQLTNVNLKNGNNSSITSTGIDLTKNPLLTCIVVDNAIYSNEKWAAFKDATASYSTADCAQITAIPDPAFEDKLIALKIDNDGKNGTVLNSSISSITSLNVVASNIKDLTGIKGFTSLQTLNCSGNQLAALDISQNKSLISLDCSSNKLVSLNLKNGNNKNFTGNSNFTKNLDLSCIQVDDQAYSGQNWTSFKDNTANYNVDCTSYTTLADTNFEQKLIDLGIDKDGLNGKIATADINSITSLDLSGANITDLSGLENFTALTYLDCDNNNLTSIDVSKNTLLTKLSLNSNRLTSLDVTANAELFNLAFSNNQISSIDLSQNKKVHYVIADQNLLTSIDFSANPELEIIYCGQNNLTSLNVSNLPNLKDLNCIYTNISQLDVTSNPKLENLYFNNAKLTTLDLSGNPLLKRLNVSNNQLTTLDISHNPLLELIFVEFNPLVSLNVKNGNNKNFILPTQSGKKTATQIYTSFLNNSNLTCIKVDDVAYSNANWSKIKETTTNYSETCTLGLEDAVFDKATVYPNPTKGEVNIQNVSVEKVTVYDTNGKLVRSFQLNSNESNNKIDLSGLPRGIYYLYLINQDAASAKKIIVE